MSYKNAIDFWVFIVYLKNFGLSYVLLSMTTLSRNCEIFSLSAVDTVVCHQSLHFLSTMTPILPMPAVSEES